MPQFDEFEIRMLDLLQSDGRKPVSELAQEIGLSTTPCARRFDALQETGVIKGFPAVIGRRAVGLAVEVFIQVRLTSHSDEFARKLHRRRTAHGRGVGLLDDDRRLRLPAARHGAVGRRSERVRHAPADAAAGVRDVHTQLVLQNIKGPGHVPLEHLRR